MQYGTPGVPSSPGFPVGGTKADGKVPTVQADNETVEWEAGGGGGAGDVASLSDITNAASATDGQVLTANGDDTFTFEDPAAAGEGLAVVGTPWAGAVPRYNAEASPAEYTVDRWITDRIFNAADYGASGDSRQAVTSGSTAAGTSVALAAGQGAMFRRGNHLVIPFAGAASPFAAVTPATPTIGNQGTAASTRYDYAYCAMDGNGGTSLPSAAGNTTTGNGTLSSTNRNVIGHPICRVAGEAVTFTAAASVATIPFTGTEFTGIVVQVSSSGTLPAGLVTSTFYWLRTINTSANTYSIHATFRDAVQGTNAIALDAGSGTHTITRYQEADGYLYYGRGTSSRTILTRRSGAANAFFVTHQAGGYTNCVAGDVGKVVVYSATNRGTLRWFDNATRTWLVEMDYSGQNDYFPSGSACTITTGTGVGTTTGNAVEWIVHTDCGDTEAACDHRTFAYKASTVYEEGDLVLASSNWYEVDATFKNRTSNSSAPTFDTDLNDYTSDGASALRFRRVNTMLPVNEPTDTLPQCYFGEVTAVSTDTLTVTPSTTSTVATGSMVAHNDFPAAKAAFDALIAFGGGELFCPGDQNWYTDQIGGNSWTRAPGGGVSWSLFELAQSVTTLNRFRLRLSNGGVIRVRPLDVPAYIDNTSSQDGGAAIFNFVTAFRPEIDLAGGRLLCVPACEPGGEADSGTNDFFVGTAVNGSSVHDMAQAPWIHDGSISGFCGYGQLTAMTAPGCGPLIENVHMRYSMGGGHDAGFGTTTGGTWRGGSLEGIRRYGSTAIYTQSSTTDPVILDGVFFKNLKGDCIRVRSPYFTMTNCTYIGGPATNGTGSLLFENMINARITGNHFEMCRDMRLGGDNILFEDNTVTDSNIIVTATSGYLGGCAFRFTAAKASGSGIGDQALLITTGATRFNVGPNTWDYSGTPNYIDGIFVNTATAGAQINITQQTGRIYSSAFLCSNTFVGNLKVTNCDLYANDSSGATNVVYLYAGNGAIVEMSNNVWTGSSGTDDYAIGNGASTAQYKLTNERSALQLTVSNNVSGAVVIEGGNFSSSTAAAISKNGTVLRGVEFAVAPTLTGTGLFTKGCTVAGSPVSSPAALASGASALTLPVTDYVRLDPDAANSSLSGMTARASGVEVYTVNIDAGAATLTYTNNSGVTEANEFLTNTGADFVDSANKTRGWWYDATTAKWRDK